MKTCKNDDCCKEMPHPAILKTCQLCKQAIYSGGCEMCNDCAKKQNECGHCRSLLVE
jgi:hypothetical protein